MKSVDEIKLLIDKFYEGNTSHEEESELKAFFEADDTLLPDELKADKETFALLAEAEDELLDEIVVPEGLDEELSKLIDREAQSGKVVKTRWNWRQMSGIAASICIIVTIGVFLITNQSNDTELYADGVYLKNAYIPQTEEEAAREAGKALALISEKLSLANERMEIATTKINELTENQN